MPQAIVHIINGRSQQAAQTTGETLAIIALVVAEFTTSTVDPTFTTLQATVFGLLTALLYGMFLFIQTSRRRSFFTEPQKAPIRGKLPDEPEPHPA